MMLGQAKQGRLRRLLILQALLLGLVACCAPSAFAAAQWEVAVEAENPFGEASFERNSGANLYKVMITNVGDEVAGARPVGGVLECEGGAETASSVSYQWLRNGQPIAGADSRSYLIGKGDEGAFLQCEAVSTTPEGVGGKISLPTPVAPAGASAPPVNQQFPANVGHATVGETRTCSARTWAPVPDIYEYIWMRNGVPIAGAESGATGATSFTYTLTGADAGTQVQCKVIAGNSGGATAAMSNSVYIAGVPPVATVAPSVSGVATSGESLICANGTWGGKPADYEYQWLRNGVPIHGARLPHTTAASFTYTVTSEDEGAVLQCEVSAFGEGATAATSAPLAVGATLGEPSSPPTIGLASARVGSSLACAHGTWVPAATSYEYRWLLNGAPIEGAGSGPGSTAASVHYTPVDEDGGQVLQCEVIATNAGGGYTAALSNASYVLAPNILGLSANLTSPAITLTNALPVGVEASPSKGQFQPTKAYPSGWSCELTDGRSTNRCTTASDLLAPGESWTFEFWVYTTSAAADVANDTATVAGGSTSPDEATVVYPTPITPGNFAIESFTTTVLDGLGIPFTQSVGHPFEAKAEFTFRPTTSETAPIGVSTAGGEPKNVAVELPPGFIGSPGLEEHCSVREFHEEECEANHPNSAIGYINIATFGGIENGKAQLELGEFAKTNEALDSSPIYNLTPPAGTPAAFGFTAVTQHFYLAASVRSDSDYGVTITSINTPNSPVALEAAEVVFCGYGSYQATYGASGVRNGCKPAVPGQVSFLSNPAQCTGSAPQTTLKVNTWEHPGTYVSKTVYTGASAGVLGGEPSVDESFVSGCEGLAFEPQVVPLPMTSQADAPTGLSVSLKVPQENDVPALTKGEQVTCLNGLWVGNPSAYSYQWLRDGAAIAGATEQAYVLANVDEAESLQCRVTATNASSGAEGVSPPLEQASSVPAPPAGAPTVSGYAIAGLPLSCTAGAWSGSPTSYAYQWLKNGSPIAGATGSTYVVGGGDAPAVLQCQVGAENAAGSTVAVSAGVNTLLPAPAEPLEVKAIPGASAPSTAAGTPEVRDVSMKFPAGLSVSPSAADGLEGCTDAQFGVHSLASASCPDASKIGTVKITTPLLPAPLEGQLFLGQPLCGGTSPCTRDDAQDGKMFRLFLQAIDPAQGVVVKVPGTVSADPTTGQLTASFVNNPQLPFEDLELRLKSGPRAPLATPQECGIATTRSEITPWSAPGFGGISGGEAIEGTPSAVSEESFDVSWNGQGEACPGSLPFSPGLVAGTTSTAAAANGSNALSVSLSREDREQDLGGIALHTPAGLLGYVSKVSLCEEPEAAQGACPTSSRIGSVTAGAGPGSHPYFVSGAVYLTGPYRGDPFGLSIVVPTKAGPFNLGNVVVRASVAVDPHTAELTVTSDPLPQILDGIPLRLRKVNVTVDKEGFIVNPTSCEAKQISATIVGAPPREEQSEAVKSRNASSSFDVGGCAEVPFKPSFSASTQAKTSRANGASLHVKIAYPAGGGQANIRMVHVELPKALPSRLSTLQKACPEATFDANPASCPSASVVGKAIAYTPVLAVPLQGPAYFVSHGGAKFPELILVLQGQGVTIMLEGETFISKAGVTSSTFKTVPDAPVSSFELTLPEGRDSALAAPGNKLCAQKLVMPTTITAQSGKQIVQRTRIQVQGCPDRIEVVSHKLKRRTVTLKIAVPAAGKLTAKGKGLAGTAKISTGAETLTLKLKLKLKQRKHAPPTGKVKIKLAFSPSTGKTREKLKAKVVVVKRKG